MDHIETQTAVLLGIKLDSRLTWMPHIEGLIVRLSRSLFAIRSMISVTGMEIAIVTYYSHIYSQMVYGLRAWGSSALTEKVSVMQKKTIRAIMQAGQNTHCKSSFKRLGIFTLLSIYVSTCIMKAKTTQVT